MKIFKKLTAVIISLVTVFAMFPAAKVRFYPGFPVVSDHFLSGKRKKNDASIILKGKAFQNPSSVSCLEGIPDFRSDVYKRQI